MRHIAGLLILASLPCVAHAGPATVIPAIIALRRAAAPVQSPAREEITVDTFSAVEFRPACKVRERDVRCKFKQFMQVGKSARGKVRHLYLLKSPWLTAEYVNNELHISCGEHMRCVWVDRE